MNKIALLFLTLLVSSFHQVTAQVPVNDDCENAIALVCGQTVVGSTDMATDSGYNESGDVFYTFTGQGVEQSLTVSLCDGGTTYDSFLRIFDDACELVNEVIANDDTCNLQSEVSFLSDGTTTYTILVEGYQGLTGQFSLAIICAEPCIAPTDLMADNFMENAVDISWSASPDSAGYNWEIQNAGVTQGTAGAISMGGILENEFTATGPFVDGESYTLYVQSECSFLNSSAYQSIDFAYQLLSTEDINFNGFELYPNPAGDVLNLSATAIMERIVLMNMLGQNVMEYTVNAAAYQLDLSTLNSGAYFIAITINNTSEIVRFIKI
jgi:hypothetical protein